MRGRGRGETSRRRRRRKGGREGRRERWWRAGVKMMKMGVFFFGLL